MPIQIPSYASIAIICLCQTDKISFYFSKKCPNVCVCAKFVVPLQRKSRNMTKEEQYKETVAEVEAVVAGETDMIANMANVASILHETFGFWWTGFYRVDPSDSPIRGEGKDERGVLVLGPFQGSLACTRIPYGKGVCGTAWAKNETVIVPNVHEFAGHIACSSESNSEIVVPVRQNGEVIAVLDIDSKEFSTFDKIDKEYLEVIADCLSGASTY